MFTAIAAACLLFTVQVRDCDPRMQAYQAIVQRLPAQHWQLINEVYIRDGNMGWANWSADNVRVGLPLPAELSIPQHEVGHAVAHKLRTSGGQFLISAYRGTFWPHGKLRGQTSAYGSMNADEDFADCYRYLLRGGGECDQERYGWIVAQAFGGVRPAISY